MIILTSTQANRVRGLVIPGHALAPIPLANGMFALPEQVLDDPVFAGFRNVLAALPRREVKIGSASDPTADSELELDPVKRARYAYKSDWRAGDLIEDP